VPGAEAKSRPAPCTRPPDPEEPRQCAPLLPGCAGGTNHEEAHKVAAGAVIMNTMAVYGTVDHLDLNPVEVCEFADLFYRAALQIQMAGYSDGRTVGVIQGSGQGPQTWYPSISFRLMDEIVTYSLTPENAAALAVAMEHRAAASAISGCAASAAFFRFFADELPGMIRFAERKSASGARPKRKGMSLAVMPVAGQA
jgi:hypothetical protein